MEKQDKIEIAPNLPLVAMHVACGLALWTGDEQVVGDRRKAVATATICSE